MLRSLFPLLVILALSILCVIADYCLKLASGQAQALRSPAFACGTALYALSALGWVQVFRQVKFATVGAVFGVTTILLLAVVGVLRFDDTLNARECVGLVFALAAVVLLGRYA